MTACFCSSHILWHIFKDRSIQLSYTSVLFHDRWHTATSLMCTKQVTHDPLLFFLKNFKSTSHWMMHSTAPIHIWYSNIMHMFFGYISGSTATFIQQCIRISSQSASNVQWAMWPLQITSLFDYASFCSNKHMQTLPLLSSGMCHSADLGQYCSPTWCFHSHVHSVSSLLWNVGTYLPNHMVLYQRSHHNKNTSEFYWPSE